MPGSKWTRRTAPQLDLFGEPIMPPRPPGRPPHVPTETLRAKVRRLRAKGCSQPEIAVAIGITVPTLVLHYARQLKSKSRARERLVERHAKWKAL